MNQTQGGDGGPSNWEPVAQKRRKQPGLLIGIGEEDRLVGLSPYPVVSHAVSRHIVSELNWIVEHPAGVCELLGVMSTIPPHTGIKCRNLTALNHHCDKPQVDSSGSTLLIEFILETISGHRVENLGD